MSSDEIIYNDQDDYSKIITIGNFEKQCGSISFKEIQRAIKLQRLVNERIEQTNQWKEHPDWINKEGISIIQGQFVTNTELQSLLEESEK